MFRDEKLGHLQTRVESHQIALLHRLFILSVAMRMPRVLRIGFASQAERNPPRERTANLL